MDFEEWTYHINEANLTPELPPTWYKFYNFKEAFGMDRMRPSDLSTLLERMATSQNLLDFYAMYVGEVYLINYRRVSQLKLS